MTGKTVVLLVGGLLIGLASGERGVEQVQPLFGDLFKGALTLFLLELGLLATAQLRDFRSNALFLVAFGVTMPLVHGAVGVFGGHLAGLSAAGSGVLGAMVASASYIAAPAAVRMAIPEARPSLYLTASLAITFPFNLMVGVPVFLELSRAIGS